MRILPFVPGRLAPETRRWGTQHDFRLIELSLAPDAYWDLLHFEWSLVNEDTVILEQDVVPIISPQKFEICLQYWCSCEYQIGTGIPLRDGLGYTRFSKDLKRAEPDLLLEVAKFDGPPGKDWHRLDTRISQLLRERGYTPHSHGPATHLHHYG